MSIYLGTIYGTDSLNILVTVTDTETDMPLSLTGATLSAAANNGSTTVSGTTSINDADAGEIAVSFASGAFLGNPGDYTAHVRVTKDTELQTVAVVAFEVDAAFVA